MMHNHNEPFALIPPEVIKERLDTIGRNISIAINRAGKSDVMQEFINAILLQELEHNKRVAREDYRRGQITDVWYDESASIMEPPKPKPKNKPWYGKFNKGKYQK